MRPQTCKTRSTHHKSHTIAIFVCFFSFIIFVSTVRAEENINVNLRIETPEQTILNQQISVPESCEVTDSVGATSTFSGYKTICVLQSAQEQSLLNYNVNNFGWGLFVEKINNIGNDENMFWSLYQNNSASMLGATDLPVNNNDKIIFSYVDWNYTNEILQIALSSSTAYINSSTILNAQTWNGSEFTNFNSEVNFFIDNTLYQSTSGTLEYTPDSEGQKEIYVEAVGKTRSEKINLSVITVPPVETTTTSTTTSTTEQDSNNDNQNNNTNQTTGNNNQTSTSTPLILISSSQIQDTTNKIINYLKSQQSSDGKIIDGTISDWSIMSFGANNEYADDIKISNGQTLLDYEKKYNLDDSSDMNACASYPRHILALLSAGVSKQDQAIIDLDNLIHTTCYQNNLYGLNGINDDIFGLLALLAIDTNTNEPIISDITNTIKADQTVDGAFTWTGWAGVDMTGAAINALKYAQTKGIEIDNNIFIKAKNYLKANQLSDGGWGFNNLSDVMTTSWVLMGINSLGENQNDWFTASGTNPWYPLINKLNADGYYESYGALDWFAMKHAVPALTGKSWPIILPTKVTNFSQDATYSYNGNNSNYIIIEINTTTPTSTLDITTTTIDISSTTLDIATTTLEITTTTENITTTTEDTILTPGINNEDKKNDTKIIQKFNKNFTNNTTKKETQEEPEQLLVTNYYFPVSTTNETLSANTSSTPLQSTAKGVFATATTMASGLGLYLGWKLLQTLL